MEGIKRTRDEKKKNEGRRTCSQPQRAAGLEEAVETEINEKLADEKFVESSNVRECAGRGKKVLAVGSFRGGDPILQVVWN